MMNCWKTVNVTREVGTNRINLISFLLGLLSFIVLFLPFSIIHQSNNMKDHGIFPLLIGLALLPIAHKLMHILPLILTNKRLKLKWHFIKGLIPICTLLTQTKTSKQITIFFLLAPTIFLTVPGLIASYLFPNYFAYCLIFTAFNIGLSYTDFLYAIRLIKAPKKCIVENAKDGYDILVN